jgi:polysaccharide pyruvyl transferase CsaB
MNFLLSGYYGFGNAGDEAVLAAILDQVGDLAPGGAHFVVTAGDPAVTVALHGHHVHNNRPHRVDAVPRQHPRQLARAIKACDVFISGGGSLLQDVTSLRNIVYYTTLIRFARLSHKPVMIYAQGIGPLIRPLSQKLARAAVQSARAISVRDEDSKRLLQRIGVRRNIEVTADPVWALTPAASASRDGETNADAAPGNPATWGISLRPWPGYEYDPRHSSVIAAGLRRARETGGARFRFLPMQWSSDRDIIGGLYEAGRDELVDTSGLHPRAIMAECGRCDVMIAMRLHALIFAAAQRVPCVAINYDPKVEALAHLIGAPLLQDLSASELAKLPDAVRAARPIPTARLDELQRAARRNAELAVGLARGGRL